MLAPLGLGLEFAAVLVVCSVVGLWVDRHYGTAPWGSLIGVGVGLAGGLYSFLKGAKRAWRSSTTSPSQNRNTADRA